MKNPILLALAAGISVPALAQADRSVLPIPAAPFAGTIAENVVDSRPVPPQSVRAPQGAPNILLMMSDDVGFSMSSAFGGPVPTPNMERLAARGQRYNRFHTTGICSPSRAALLTGRNHHKAGVGYLSDLPAGFPGYGGRILPETATIAQVLRLNGYSTAMFGKHHNVPITERSEAGPFDVWPTGLGFDYFLGFVSGDTDQFNPSLYRGIHRVDPREANGKLLDERLADDLIRWIRNQQAGAPEKPFLAYFAPGSTHAPHQAPADWIARFRGQFDKGWDVAREETFRRQLAMGIVPRGTRLTQRPDGIPAWAALSMEQRAFAARSMEVAAAQLAFQDAQIGRILDELERMGQIDNTLVVLVNGDNGASGEGGPDGTVNELRSMGTHGEDPAWLAANTDNLGGPSVYGNYPAGWAWAMNAPLRWTKQFASMLGGVRNGMILSFAGHVTRPGSVCAQFSHLVDIVPTVLDAAKLPMPKLVYGAGQKPLDGESLLPSLTACDAAKPRTQYFEIGGKTGLYHNGWFLSGEDGRASWDVLPPGGVRPQMQWSLYDLSRDFSQSTDLAAKEPQRLQDMRALWQQVAQANNVFPLDHRFASARAFGRGAMGGAAGSPRQYDFWGKDVSIPANNPPVLMARPFTLEAELRLDSAEASGVVLALGSRFGGWSLYLDQGRPAFVWARSTDPKELWSVQATKPLAQGASKLTMRFAAGAPGKEADILLSADGQELARLHLPVNYLIPAGGGETLDIGRDLGVPVTNYRTPNGTIEGDVTHVSVTFD